MVGESPSDENGKKKKVEMSEAGNKKKGSPPSAEVVAERPGRGRRQKVKRCRRCVLPETFPGIRFDAGGVCQYCASALEKKDFKTKKMKYRGRFEELLEKHKGRSAYDVLMCYSGGKDSTYVLTLLREQYDLKVYAVTYDNGFLPPQTVTNIREVTAELGMDHVLFRPRFDMLRKIFAVCASQDIYPPQTLTRASTICTSCMAIVKFHALRTSLEMEIPFIAFGWSPGQIPLAASVMKNNPRILRVMQKAVFDPLHRIAGDGIRPYFLEEKHFSERLFYPYNISPLAFLEYDEETILKKVETLGWERPQGIDANTTNCLLNSFANKVHKKKHGFHPYVFEMAKLVREGYMDREEALRRIEEKENRETIERVRLLLFDFGGEPR